MIEAPPIMWDGCVRIPRSLVAMSLCGLLLGLARCGGSAFPKHLFTLEAHSADYPMMVSRTRSEESGRAIRATSGVGYSEETHSGLGGEVTVTRSSESVRAASEALASKVRRSDEWVELEECVFIGSDTAGWSGDAFERTLTIEARAH